MAIDIPDSLARHHSNGGQATESNGHNGHHSSAANAECNNDIAAAASSSSANVAEDAYASRPRRMTNARCLPVVGLFAFYVVHDALQERMFRFDGFEFGFFMTLVEVVVMLVGSVLAEGDAGIGGILASFSKRRTKRKGGRRALPPRVLIRIGWVGLFLALAHGLGNTSLNYSPYPLKVAFKSCKLVPTMALGACVTGRRHTALQFTAALVMGMGLAVLTAADVFSSKQKMPLAQGTGDSQWSKELGPLLGPILLTISTVFDSIVPNLQEKLLQTAKVKTSEMILVSNMVMCFVLVGYTIYSGELISAWEYCSVHGDASGVLLAQGLSAYLGLKCYLAIIRDYGGVVGVLLANARKIVTIILSFLLFAKPFNERHVVGLMLVFVGVYLGYISKRGKRGASDNEGTPSKDKKGRKKRKGECDKSHEHNV